MHRAKDTITLLVLLMPSSKKNKSSIVSFAGRIQRGLTIMTVKRTEITPMSSGMLSNSTSRMSLELSRTYKPLGLPTKVR